MILRISLTSRAFTEDHPRQRVIKHGANFGNVSHSSTSIQGICSYMVMLVGGVRIPPEKMHLLNRTVGEGDWRMIPDEAGGGYIALLDVFHQIHCLVSPFYLRLPELRL
jgi:Mycotoxin biosynthesis protein UstYa